jgi:hypothetical protein
MRKSLMVVGQTNADGVIHFGLVLVSKHGL